MVHLKKNVIYYCLSMSLIIFSSLHLEQGRTIFLPKYPQLKKWGPGGLNKTVSDSSNTEPDHCSAPNFLPLTSAVQKVKKLMFLHCLSSKGGSLTIPFLLETIPL